MAVYFYTTRPNALYTKFKDAIAQTEKKGKIETWLSSGNDLFTHASDWKNLAWMKAEVDAQKRLRFNIIRPKGKNVDVVTYAYYHGHLMETFLAHFDRDFTEASATAIQTTEDDVNGA